jgi:hypothetical protein
MPPLSDHQDSEHFSYERSWEDIESMLREAEKVQNDWVMKYFTARERNNREGMKIAARNKKALEGVVKTLRWVLGDMTVQHPLD